MAAAGSLAAAGNSESVSDVTVIRPIQYNPQKILQYDSQPKSLPLFCSLAQWPTAYCLFGIGKFIKAFARRTGSESD